LLRNSYS